MGAACGDGPGSGESVSLSRVASFFGGFLFLFFVDLVTEYERFEVLDGENARVSVYSVEERMSLFVGGIFTVG